jgi:hypothetical protein
VLLLQPHLERTLGQSVELQFVGRANGPAGHLMGAEHPGGDPSTMINPSPTAQPSINRASMAKLRRSPRLYQSPRGPAS